MLLIMNLGNGYIHYYQMLILNKIPENRRSSVYNYETSSQWLLSGLEPYDKYCITADHFFDAFK